MTTKMITKEDNSFVIILADQLQYYKNNLMHREDGPARINSNGMKDWFFYGILVTHEVEDWLEERSINHDNMSDEDKLALSFFMRSLI